MFQSVVKYTCLHYHEFYRHWTVIKGHLIFESLDPPCTFFHGPCTLGNMQNLMELKHLACIKNYGLFLWGKKALAGITFLFELFRYGIYCQINVTM